MRFLLSLDFDKCRCTVLHYCEIHWPRLLDQFIGRENFIVNDWHDKHGPPSGYSLNRLKNAVASCRYGALTLVPKNENSKNNPA